MKTKHADAISWFMRNRTAQIFLLVALVYLYLQWAKMDEIHGFLWFTRPHSNEIYFTDYPKLVGSQSEFTVYSNTAVSCSLCGSNVALHEGLNRLSFVPDSCAGNVVRLDCGDKNLSFSFVRVQTLPRESVSASVSPSVEARSLNLRLSGSGTANGYHALEIFIDGRLASSPLHMLNGTFSFTESVPVQPGEHAYEVIYNGEVLASGVFAVPSPFSPSAFSTALLCVAIVLWDAGWLRLPIFIVLAVASLVVEFRLQQIGAGFFVPVALAGFLFYRIARKARRVQEDSNLALEAAVFGAAFTGLILVLNIAISTYDIWGAYYFRHAEQTFAHGTTDYWDRLSYLGRPSTYPPIFFEFAAQFTRLLGFAARSYEDVRVPLDLLLSFTYAASSYLVFRRFPFNQRLFAAAIVVTLWGTLMTAAGIGIHLLAFTLMNCAVILLDSNPLLAAVSLALGFAAHPLAMLFYPFLVFSANGFRMSRGEVLSALLIAAAGVLLSLPFYIPIFFRAGLPYEIVPQRWGYLLSYGLDGIRFSLNFLLPLALVTIAFALHRRMLALPALLLLALILMTAYVSLRLDMAVAIVLAGLAPSVFERELDDARFLRLALLSYILPNVLVGAVVMNGTTYYCAWGLSNEMCSSPMEYLSRYAPTESAVALNPIYGHLEAYLGKRPVLADLYVEYADYEKFKAESDFYENGNITGLLRYNVSYAILDDFPKPRALPWDRIYDNGYMHAFRRS